MNNSASKKDKRSTLNSSHTRDMKSKFDRLPNIKGAISPPENEYIHKDGINCMNGLGVTREKSIAATVANSQAAVGFISHTNIERSLERNSSVLSRKELIKQEYNHLLETRLPSIMQLMNSEKTIGLQLGFNE